MIEGRWLGAVVVLALGIFLAWFLVGGLPLGPSSVEPVGGASPTDSIDPSPARLAGAPGEALPGAAPGGSDRAPEDIEEGGAEDRPLAVRVRVQGTNTAVAFASLMSADGGRSLGGVTDRSGQVVLGPDERGQLGESRVNVVAGGFFPYPLPSVPDEQEVYVVDLTPKGPVLTLAGRVADTDGRPIAGAYVEIAGRFLARSEADGTFVALLPVDAPEVGKLEVVGWAPAFLVADASVEEVGPAPWSGFVDVVLAPAEGWAPLTLRVTRASGEPAGGAEYVLRATGQPWDDTQARRDMLRFVGDYMPTRGTVPASGRLVFPALPTAPALLRVKFPGEYAEAVVAASAENPEVEVVLGRGRGALVSFDIEQGVGSPVSQVTCLPVLEFDDGVCFCLEPVPAVDASTQEIGGLPPSEFTLVLGFRCRPSVRVRVPAAVGPSDDLIQIPCRLSSGRVIRGTIGLEKGGLVADGFISVETEQGETYKARIRAGKFEIPNFVGQPRQVTIRVALDVSGPSRSTFLTAEAYNWDSDVWLLTVD